MATEPNATLDAPELSEATAAAPEPEPKKRGPYKKKAAAGASPASNFAAYVADLPIPFRPRHLTEAIRLYAAEHDITGEALAKIDPHRFIREHGLPNPQRRFRVSGIKKGQSVEPAEFEAVDSSEAVRQFILLRSIKEAHQWKFPAVQIDY